MMRPKVSGNCLRLGKTNSGSLGKESNPHLAKSPSQGVVESLNISFIENTGQELLRAQTEQSLQSACMKDDTKLKGFPHR